MLRDGDTLYCYYTAARHTQGNPPHESCVGVSSSQYLIHWNDEGFIRLTESLRTPPESPFVVKRNDKYYLFYTNYGQGTVYAVSDHPVQGFAYPENTSLRVIPEVSASETYRDGEHWYISLISHAPNALHFFEIRRLIWEDDGGVSVTPLETP